MKRIFTLSAIVLFVSALLTGCYKNGGYYHDDGPNENYWLSKEQGEVVYSDNYCDYYVVETYYGYNVIRAYGNYKPYEGSIVYGNFSSRGTRDMYNYSSGIIFTGTVTDYWLSYDEALDALDYYCPIYGKGQTRKFRESTVIKKKQQ
jgi:hypothetical protein